MTDLSAVDRSAEQTESWLYFFDYDQVLFVDAAYADRDEAERYVAEYIESLEGFEPDDGGEEEDYDGEYDSVSLYLGDDIGSHRRFTYLEGEDVFYKCKTPEGLKSFKYRFNEDGKTLTLMFKSEKYVTAEEAGAALKEAGFPEISLAAYDSCRDFVKFQKTMYGQDYPLDLSPSFEFETSDDAAAFLDSYISVLKDDNSFDITNPAEVNMNKPMAYVKEADGKTLVFGFDYRDGWTTVITEFRVVENAQD